MRAVAKQQHGCLGEVHTHCRLTDGKAWQLGTHLGNHRRCAVDAARLGILSFGFLPLDLCQLALFLAEFGLLARYTELQGSNCPWRAGFGCPAKDVRTPSCPIKHSATLSSHREARYLRLPRR